jgi:hypothetical protein
MSDTTDQGMKSISSKNFMPDYNYLCMCMFSNVFLFPFFQSNLGGKRKEFLLVTQTVPSQDAALVQAKNVDVIQQLISGILICLFW